MRAVAIGCLLGLVAVAAMPQAQAETLQPRPQPQAVTLEDIVKQIIEEMKEHPPMSTGDHVVGEQLC